MNGTNKTESMTVEDVIRRDKRFRYMLTASITSASVTGVPAACGQAMKRGKSSG